MADHLLTAGNVIHQNDHLWPQSQFHRFSAFFPLKTRGRLKIVLPSFPARVASGESYLYIVSLRLFGQVHPTLIQWDLSLLIATANISVKGCTVHLCF